MLMYPHASRAVGALVVRCQDGKDNAGASHAKKVRRLGRPAWKRSPDDTPLRDGNRDRIQGACGRPCTPRDHA
jgi:hypothetical protein